MIVCCNCGKPVPKDAPRPTYLVKGSGKFIRPNPRCDECRTEYEKTRTSLQKVKD